VPTAQVEPAVWRRSAHEVALTLQQLEHGLGLPADVGVDHQQALGAAGEERSAQLVAGVADEGDPGQKEHRGSQAHVAELGARVDEREHVVVRQAAVDRAGDHQIDRGPRGEQVWNGRLGGRLGRLFGWIHGLDLYALAHGRQSSSVVQVLRQGARPW